MLQGKKIKVGAHKYNCSPAMHGWGVFPNNKRYSMQKKDVFVKLIYSIKTNLINQLFLQIFSEVFEKQHKIRSFESGFGCTFGCTKACIFDSYDY